MGDSAKAIECFKTVGDAYAAQGFTVKGIAMYKKITKLAPSVDGSLKLAELYTQQGLFNDARAQYLQVAEDFMKGGDLDQAIRLFQKVLEMDPENVPMRIKLAEVYIKRGKKKEAWEIFSAAAESLARPAVRWPPPKIFCSACCNSIRATATFCCCAGEPRSKAAIAKSRDSVSGESVRHRFASRGSARSAEGVPRRAANWPRPRRSPKSC